MQIRLGPWLLVCCCAVLAACTVAAPKGPDANVTTPAVGKPPQPASAQAALSSEAFTPHADIGASASDGLALGDTYAALHTACMNDSGYGQYAASAPFEIRANRGLGFPQPYGPWGYLGLSLAAQYGFNAPDTGGPDESNGSPTAMSALSAGAQAAAGKCLNILMAFNDAQFTTSLGGIETMNNEISNDVITDPDFKKATTAWSACMARNGYTISDADAFALNELSAIGLRSIAPGQPAAPTAAQNRTQIAMAVTDANCTQSTDLAGIYFAVQASYEQQFVTGNQQALNVAVRRYKAAFARELSKLPAFLRTASAKLNLPGGPRKRAGLGHASKPGASPSQPGG